MDEIEGLQALHWSNPNFSTSLIPSISLFLVITTIVISFVVRWFNDFAIGKYVVQVDEEDEIGSLVKKMKLRLVGEHKTGKHENVKVFGRLSSFHKYPFFPTIHSNVMLFDTLHSLKRK